jgi:hypothetical protein
MFGIDSDDGVRWTLMLGEGHCADMMRASQNGLVDGDHRERNTRSSKWAARESRGV